jgi:DNA-binding IclR family transcriptional regulator
LNTTTVFRLLATLAKHDLVEMDQRSGRYRLGSAVLRLAAVRGSRSDLGSLATPVMQQMRDAVGETVVLNVRSGDHRVVMQYQEARADVRFVPNSVDRDLLHSAASGKVLLAGMSDREIEVYVSRATFDLKNPDAPKGPEELRRELALIRQRGYATAEGAFIVSVAAPVVDAHGETVAALHFGIPRDRATTALREACIREVQSGARTVSRGLGHRVPQA